MRSLLPIMLGLVILSGCASGPHRTHVDVLADVRRPPADRTRDPARHPLEVLAFAGVKPGQKIGEYMPGAGYFTRILAVAVGPGGVIYANQPREIVRLQPSYLSDIQAVASAYDTVRIASTATADFGAPEPLDLVITVQNYHDFHTRFASAGTSQAFNAAVIAALKPGGRYVIIDHSALAGTGISAADPLHRIDPATVKAEVLAAGFVLEAQSTVLANPADARTASVFAPEIRGATDQFALRFRKPVPGR